MPDSTVEQLFATWRATGDPAALAAVYERTAVGLLVVARHLCGDVHAAEDVVQATFLAALRHAERYDASRPLRPWLTGILGHEVRRRRRDERRRVDPERLPVRTAHDPAAAAQSSELTRTVDEAIDRLPPIYRSVLVLKLAHGFTAAEIAHALRRPPGTVRAQLARGTELLAKALPAGLATVLAIVATPGRGLAAVRDVVLAAAARSAPTAAAAAVSTTLAVFPLSLGVLVMGMKVAAVVGISVALGIASYATWSSRNPSIAPSIAQAPDVSHDAAVNVDAADAVAVPSAVALGPTRRLVSDEATKPRGVDATAAAKPGPLSEEDKRVVNVTRVLLGIDHRRVQAILRLGEPAATEFRSAVTAATEGVLDAQRKAERRSLVIAKARWTTGQFESVPNDIPWVEQSTPAEWIHRSSLWDPVQQRDINRIVRIRPGEDAEFDGIRREHTEAVDRARSQLENLLLLYRVP